MAPGTMPQIPGMSGTFLFDETTAQSQVEVPITLTSVPSRTPQPIAP
jgi:polyisoprenoid-binding protein YceI